MTITNSTLATKINTLVQQWEDFQSEQQAWMTGTVGGGPNTDGKYVLTDYQGATVFATCPLQLEDDVQDTVTGGAAHKTAAAASATAALASENNASTSETNSSTSETNALTSKSAALVSENSAASSAATATAQSNQISNIFNKTADYTLVLADAGQTMRFTGSTGSQTFTIPANASVVFGIGARIRFENDASVSLSLAITTDTMTWSEDNTTGTRTLAAGASAVIHKTTATTWKISGSTLVT